MIAEVGGMAGLLLGVSFFHTTKLIEFFINMKIEKLQGGGSGSQTETWKRIQVLWEYLMELIYVKKIKNKIIIDIDILHLST